MASAFHCGLRVTTSRPIREIEQWMDYHCLGEWRITLDEVSKDLAVKTIRLLFENQTDREAFRRACRTEL